VSFSSGVIRAHARLRIQEHALQFVAAHGFGQETVHARCETTLAISRQSVTRYRITLVCLEMRGARNFSGR